MTFSEWLVVAQAETHTGIDLHGDIYARLKSAEIKTGCALSAPCGRGPTLSKAFEALSEEIQGELIVFNATSEDRRELRCPQLTGVNR